MKICSASECPFCAPAADRIVVENRFAVALWDGFPVSLGHTVVIPKRHVASLDDITATEWRAISSLIAKAKQAVGELHWPDGFNIGVNDGVAAGQTVMHLHVHVIPRYSGDQKDPRGGIRWVLPGQANYWDVQ